MATQKLVCIVCPQGCALEVDVEAGTVSGNTCKRGELYGLAETTNPTRTLTTTARIVDENGDFVDMAPVRTVAPIPKGRLFDAMKEIDALRLRKPIRRGDVLIADLLGTGTPVVATRDFD